jgi:aminobenzoyl-glutamate transport protein
MAETTVTPAQGTSMLDRIERLGNKIPHPVMMFVYLIIFIAVLSHILYLFDVSVTEEVAVPAEGPGLADEHGGLGGSDAQYPLYPD